MPNELINKRRWYGYIQIFVNLLFLGATQLGIAQSGSTRYEFRRISLRDGLVNQSVTTMCAVSKGALWIGTQNGLYCYDGFRLERYDLGKDPQQTIPDHYVTDLELLSPAGLVFVSTRKGTCIIDPVLRRTLPGTAPGLRNQLLGNCTQVERSSAGFYLAYAVGKVYRIDADEKGELKITIWFSTDTGKEVKMIADPDHAGCAWLLPRYSQAVYATPQGSRKFLLPSVPNNMPEAKGLIHLFYQGHTAVGWDMAWNVYFFDAARQQWVVSDKTLYDYIPALHQIEDVLGHRIIPNGALAAELEQQGICTNSGLFIVRKKPQSFHLIPALQNKEMRGIYTDSSGNWWAGTYNGLFTGNLHRQEVRYFPSLKGVWNFLPTAPDSCLLAFEMEFGIGKWDFHSETVQKNTLLYSDEAEHVLSLCRDFKGTIWAGADGRLLRNDPATPDVFREFRDPVNGQQIMQPNIRALLAARDSSIWVGTENGLFRLIFNQLARRYEIDPQSPYANGAVVSGLYPDRFGNLWLATKGNGIACRDGKGHWKWFTTADGLSHDVTCRIEGSNEDRVLWISTHSGLSRFDVAGGVFSNYYEENGLPSDEFNAGASARFRDGTLCFGGLNGIVYFHPDSVLPTQARHQTIISGVHVYNSARDTLQKFYPGPEGLHLWPYPEYVEIMLGSNEFILRHTLKFRYRMLGISDNWVYTNGEREVSYFKLPPGSYVFEVQTWLPGGHLGEITRLPLTVSRPFYETLWFAALLFAACLFLAHQVYLYRVHRVLKEQAVRRQIADDLHDDIGNKLNITGILAQKIAGLHASPGTEAENDALRKLVTVTREALVSLHTMIWTVDPNKDRVGDLLTKMQDFAEDYLHPLSIACVFRLPSDIPDREVSLKVRHHLILIYQELLTNMVKYSTPYRLTFYIALLPSGLFEMEILNEHHRKTIEYETISVSRGQESMRRRLSQIGGTLMQTEVAENLQKTSLTVFKMYDK